MFAIGREKTDMATKQVDRVENRTFRISVASAIRGYRLVSVRPLWLRFFHG